MHANGEISSLINRTGTDGLGVPQYSEEQLAYPLPCAISDPSMHAVAQLGTRGIRLERIVMVQRAALDAAEISLEADDRITFARYGRESDTMTVMETYERNNSELREVRLGSRLEGGS